MKRKKVLHNLSVCLRSCLSYLACEVNARYCHLWPVRLYNSFPYSLINSTIFRNVIEHKMCVLFPLQLLSKTFPILGEFSYILLYTYICLRYSRRILMKRAFSEEIFKKYSNTKFHEIPSSESRAVPCNGQ